MICRFYKLNSLFKQTHNLLFSTLSFSSSCNDDENKKELPANGCIWKCGKLIGKPNETGSTAKSNTILLLK
jgi:hypothetical protein